MEARQPFSRLGWALFAQMAVMLAAQWGVLLLARAARPGLLGEPVFLWAASVLGAYGLGIPAACLVLWGTAAPPAPAPQGAPSAHGRRPSASYGRRSSARWIPAQYPSTLPAFRFPALPELRRREPQRARCGQPAAP